MKERKKERRYTTHNPTACSFLPIFTSLVEWWQSSSLTYLATTPLLHSLLRWSATLTLERECTENEKIEKKDKEKVGVDLLLVAVDTDTHPPHYTSDLLNRERDIWNHL